MHLKKLEVFGFKSFADKTYLDFESGITAVVGPNGCGKSNVFDAVRWVLGEQSMKELRGSTREDVIFSGTDKKLSLGFCEVSLTISNEDKKLDIEYDEVVVTRRLFRSGESEYLLNKTVVRLKDIQALFMGTGIGADAYSFIQQGRVDQVVSARPEDRRVLLDEASGITKYKVRKKEALSKLKSTDENLLRVNDIVVEIKRQITSIERQANKARKYKEHFENLKNLEIKLARYQMSHFSELKGELEKTLKAFREKEVHLNEELEELSNLLTNEINHLDDIEVKINEFKADEIKLNDQIDLNNRQIGFNEERLANLDESRIRLLEQKDQLIEKCKMQQEKVEELRTVLAELENAVESSENALSEKKESMALLERALNEAKEKIAEHEEKKLELTTTHVEVNNNLTDVMKEVQSGIARQRRLDVELEKVQLEKSEVEERYTATDCETYRLQGELYDWQRTKENRERMMQGLRARMDQLDDLIIEREKKSLFYESQKEFIEKMNTQFQESPDPIIQGRMITDVPPEEHHTGIIGKVKEVVTRDFQETGYSNITEGASKKVYEVSCEAKFIELDSHEIARRIEAIHNEIESLIAQKGRMAENIKEEGYALGKVAKIIHEKEKDLSVLQSQRNDILNEMKKLEGELEIIEAERLEVNGSLTVLQQREKKLEYELDTINKNLDWCEEDVKDKRDRIAEKTIEKEEMAVGIAQLETELNSLQDKSKHQQENLEMFSSELDSGLEKIKNIEDEVLEQEKQKEKYSEELVGLREQIGEIQEKIAVLKTEMAEFETQKEDIAQRINTARANMTACEDEVGSIKDKVHDQKMDEQKLVFNLQSMKDRLQQSYEIDLDSIIENDRKNITIETSEQGEGAEEAKEEVISEEELAAEIGVLRKRCQSYGTVNLVAIEEFEELRERFEFLTQQQSDLLEAKSQLMSTISKINRSTRKMFLDTFEKVDHEFRTLFRLLFGGGEAQLILLDHENVLESGIDIVAKPPGKTLQNISLLSGGERTMTAIALVFGVFKVKPSPFCVLDEIDAALDEANVDRFVAMLKEFSKLAQFIVITHNKKTIVAADILYGVTMPERGVSRLVSVKFEEDKKEVLEEQVPAGV